MMVSIIMIMEILVCSEMPDSCAYLDASSPPSFHAVVVFVHFLLDTVEHLLVVSPPQV